MYVVSGPINVNSSDEVRIEAIVFVIKIIITGVFGDKPMDICSDSRVAIKAINLGFKHPIQGPLHIIKVGWIKSFLLAMCLEI